MEITIYGLATFNSEPNEGAYAAILRFWETQALCYEEMDSSYVGRYVRHDGTEEFFILDAESDPPGYIEVPKALISAARNLF
jgi:hypothetical protein